MLSYLTMVTNSSSDGKLLFDNLKYPLIVQPFSKIKLPRTIIIVVIMETNGTATLSELKNVLKETLEARGSLGQIKARIRAEIFAALDDQDVPKPKLSNENIILNELIREYCEYNGYRHTLSVLLSESGQPIKKAFPREFIASELNGTVNCISMNSKKD